MTRKIAGLVLVLAGLGALPLLAQDVVSGWGFTESHLELLRGAAGGEKAVSLPAQLTLDHAKIPIHAPACVLASTACGRRETGFLEAGDCGVDGGNPAVDFYQFVGSDQYTVTIDMQSAQFDTFLVLLDGDANVLASDDDGGPGSNSRITFTLPEDDTFVIAASSFGIGEEGKYTLNLRCEGTTNPGTCAPGPNVLCLSNKRFAVISAFSTAQETDLANVVELTPDTGYLWFFDQNNVEAVVKVLNTCNVPQFNRFWVFAGGLTNVSTAIRVVDTESGQFLDYVNNPLTPFQPIQDTNAFATCP